MYNLSTKMKKQIFKKLLLVFFILLTIPLVAIILIVRFQDGYVEQKFNKEASKIPGLRTKVYSIFEGGLSAQIDIPDKGKVQIMYGLLGLEYIRYIGNFDTIFLCPEDKTTAVGLSLRKGSKFSKWFPFDVNNLEDLVYHYHDILSILNTFPRTPNPQYKVTTTSISFGIKKIDCSIYLKR